MIRFIEMNREVGMPPIFPKRATKGSAGYDLCASHSYIIRPYAGAWKFYNDQEQVLKDGYMKDPLNHDLVSAMQDRVAYLQDRLKPTMVGTGVRVEMEDDMYGLLTNRSSNGTKRGIVDPNGVGIIDADYHDEIMVPFINLSAKPIKVERGQRIAQLVFNRYLTVDDDYVTETRHGGFGSTDKGGE